MRLTQDREKLELILNDNSAAEDQLKEMSFTLVKYTQIYFDSEKGYTGNEIVIQRKSDGKYFKGEYGDWGHGIYEYYNDWKEVFPKQITTTIYE